MSNSSNATPDETYLVRLKSSRQNSAVLKAQLMLLRSGVPDTVILAMEGDDDKIVYGQWIRRLRPGWRYEPFVCGGKKGVKALKSSISRDLGGLKNGLYFLVDRDFDDLSGFSDTESVFMTESYSVENHIVGRQVLEEVLRDEFPCHARPDIRRRVGDIFDQDYDEFLRVTSEINRRILIARRVPIALTQRLPKTIKSLAAVEIGRIEPSATAAEKIVVYEREPKKEEVDEVTKDFVLLDPRRRYRGKFAMRFFVEWLGKLADEHSARRLDIFDSDVSGGVRRAELVLSNFAAKSHIPICLAAFVNGIP